MPLKLRTEAMVMRDGKLATAPNGQSSKGAAFFAKWFTDNYDTIAAETRIESEKKQGNTILRQSVYGGVALSPPPEAVKSEPSPAADVLAPLVRAAVENLPALAPAAVGRSELIPDYSDSRF